MVAWVDAAVGNQWPAREAVTGLAHNLAGRLRLYQPGGLEECQAACAEWHEEIPAQAWSRCHDHRRSARRLLGRLQWLQRDAGVSQRRRQNTTVLKSALNPSWPKVPSAGPDAAVSEKEADLERLVPGVFHFVCLHVAYGSKS